MTHETVDLARGSQIVRMYLGTFVTARSPLGSPGQSNEAFLNSTIFIYQFPWLDKVQYTLDTGWFLW